MDAGSALCWRAHWSAHWSCAHTAHTHPHPTHPTPCLCDAFVPPLVTPCIDLATTPPPRRSAQSFVEPPLARAGVTLRVALLRYPNTMGKPGPAFNFLMSSAHEDGADYLCRVNDDTQFVSPWVSQVKPPRYRLETATKPPRSYHETTTKSPRRFPPRFSPHRHVPHRRMIAAPPPAAPRHVAAFDRSRSISCASHEHLTPPHPSLPLLNLAAVDQSPARLRPAQRRRGGPHLPRGKHQDHDARFRPPDAP